MLCENKQLSIHSFVIVQEGFFSQNWLYIGKCYYTLNNKSEAKIWLKKAAEVTADNQDDNEVCVVHVLYNKD